MNHLHLQETAKHYAKLAEEAQKNLEQEKELNEDLLTIIDALCEELDIDVEELLGEMAMTRAGLDARRAREDELSRKGEQEKSWASQDKTDDWLRSDKVYDENGNVVHQGARGLGYSITATDPSDQDVENVQRVVGRVGHIVGVADDKGYATGPGDTEGTDTHPVWRRIVKTPKAPKAPNTSNTPKAPKAPKKAPKARAKRR